MRRPCISQTLPQVALRVLGCYTLLTIAFSVLLVASYALPQGRIRVHVEESVPVLAAEGEGHMTLMSDDSFWTDPSYRIDNFTNAIMLNEASHGYENPLRGAFLNLRRLPVDGGTVDAVTQGLGDSGEVGDYHEHYEAYLRYWHGYLVLLKPLLMFLNLTEIRMLGMLVLSSLIAVACALLARREGVLSALVFGVSFAWVNLTTVSASLSFLPGFLLSLLGSIWVLTRGEGWRVADPTAALRWALSFYALGALTVYLDFLCNPIITLGIPLALLVYLGRDGIRRESVVRALLSVVLICVAWTLGYASLLATKWVLSALVTGEDAIQNGVAAVGVRMSNVAFDHTDITTDAVGVIERNFSAFLPDWAAKFALVSLAVLGVACAVRNRALRDRRWWWVIPLLVVALLPYVWYAVFVNHSSAHFWFTYRNQMVTALCLGLIVGALAHGLRRCTG